MFDLELEKALKERCDADHQYETLWAQWTFDKKLVAGALNNVVLTFPHYSRHDASHSNTILQQIARVLGPARIARLGATDLWLLLEAAYQHDLGMVVPEHTEREWWKSKEFRSFLDGLQNHTDPELAAAAVLLLKRTSERVEGRDWPFEVRRALVLVLADFARRKHADQSKRFVEDPEIIGLDVPRRLIPRRFWSLLGRICQSHGANFNKIFDLPKEESGLGMDTAHPRFIASMLRLGDLLDLDDGRFCPVATVAFGGLPPSSQAHKAKHHSILEFLVTPERIRVVAECKDKDAFDATEQWLTWLRTELQGQSLRWSELGPAADFGSVPSAERIEVGLQGHMTFKDGRRPHFEVDKEAMLDMVKGAGLYNNSLACIDELLQNAVDATLLRIFEADREKWREIDRKEDNEALEKLREELKKYPIDVSITKSEPGEGGEVEWTVHIVDRGAGIHRDDIEYIQRISSSKNNKRRRERIREMPTWMRPSGIFGIGLQSVFLFSDKVTLVSRADDALETLEIDMWVSEGAKEPDIVVRILEGERARREPGTRVSFVLKSKKIFYGRIYAYHEGETRKVLSNYDPFVDDEWLVLPAQICDTVGRFAAGALASFTLDKKELNDSQAVAGSKAQWSRFFDHKTGFQLDIRADYNRPTWGNFRYRGKEIGKNAGLISCYFLGILADWHRDDASKILTLNRQDIRQEAQDEILLHVEEALKRIIPKYYEKLKNDSTRDKERQALTLAVQVNQVLRDAKLIPEDDRAWTMLGYRDTGVTLGEIVDANVVRLIEDPSLNYERDVDAQPPIKKIENGFEIIYNYSFRPDWLWNLLQDRHIQLAGMQRLTAPEYGGRRRTEWILSRDPSLDCIANDHLFKDIMAEAVKQYDLRSRCIIPCIKRFQAMALSEERVKLRWVHGRLYSHLKPRAIFPFRLETGDRHADPAKLTLSAIPKLIEYTYEHRLDPNTSELNIARAFLDLIVTLDAWFKDAWAKRIDYSVDELRRVLRKRYGDEVLQIPDPLPDPGPLED